LPRNTRSCLSFVFGEWGRLALQQSFVDEIMVKLRERKTNKKMMKKMRREIYMVRIIKK
jgi:hypothetical protein